MKEYQAVVVKLTRHTREDEDTLTDLLNERSRGGWEPAQSGQGTTAKNIIKCLFNEKTCCISSGAIMT